MDTHELVYMNKKLREAYECSTHEDYQGKICYQTLQNNLAPCAICNNHQLKCGHFNEGLRVALQTSTPDEALDVVLEYIGNALNGQHTYVFEKNASGSDDNTYEWISAGVTPEKDTLQTL